MRRYNFKGDLTQVSERQLAYIEEVLEQRGIKAQDVHFDPVGKLGENYMANVKRITVEENGDILKIVAKVAPGNKNLRQLANTGMLFRNEHAIYTEILPKFDQLQKEAGVSKEEMFRYPQCYGSLSEEPNEVILLEDLKESQFDITNRFKPMSIECVNLALKNFAKLHSFSYVLKNLEPKTYENLKSKLRDVMMDHMAFAEGSNVFLESLEKMATNAMTDDFYKNVIKGTVSEMFNNGKKCLESDKISRFSVIRQGDAWTSNIMFRMKNGTPEECILIDYQMVYESSPVYDIMYMLFNSTDHEQRLKHYDNFIDLYHSELDKSLRNFGLKAKFVYPRHQLDADLKRYGNYAFALGILVACTSLKTPEEAATAKKLMEEELLVNETNTVEMPDEFFEQDPKTLVLFKKRIEDLVDSFLEFGLLSKTHNNVEV